MHVLINIKIFIMRNFNLLLLFLYIVGVTSNGANNKHNKYVGIIGGLEAKLGMFPFQVSLQMKDGHRHYCGGTIINERHILTAGHCVLIKDKGILSADSISAMVGNVKLDSSITEYYEISNIYLHGLFQLETLHHDIAVLRIKSSFAFSSYVKPAELPSTSDVIDNGRIIVSGWGTTVRNQDHPVPSKNLMYAVVPLVNFETCRKKYLEENITITDTMICAGNGERDSCQGDSGGPLSLNDRVIGIVSFGIGCADNNFPGIYTKVYSYKSWIEDQLEKSSAHRCNYNNYFNIVLAICAIYSYFSKFQ